MGVVKRNIVRWSVAVVGAVAAVVAIAWVGGAFDSGDGGADDEVASEITLPPLDTTPIDTTPVETFPVPPKPDVELPETIPTDLVITTLEPGDGPEAAAGDTVTVHYVGVRTEDGTEFDNSYDRGTPFPVVLGAGGVIRGWDEGLIGAQEGARIQLDIPADLAYGDQDRGDVIRAGDALTFVIDVMDVTQAADQ